MHALVLELVQRIGAVPLPCRIHRGAPPDLVPGHRLLREQSLLDFFSKGLATDFFRIFHLRFKRLDDLILALVLIASKFHQKIGGHQPLPCWIKERGEGLAHGAQELSLNAVHQFARLHELRVEVLRTLAYYFADDVVNCFQFFGGIEHRVVIALAGEKTNAVLEVQILVKLVEVGIQALRVRLGDD